MAKEKQHRNQRMQVTEVSIHHRYEVSVYIFLSFATKSCSVQHLYFWESICKSNIIVPFTYVLIIEMNCISSFSTFSHFYYFLVNLLINESIHTEYPWVNGGLTQDFLVLGWCKSSMYSVETVLGILNLTFS